ncbi:LD-carboxypeptidase (plasmid) [Cytobacillus spongiae]|uniref:S66 family peptidase n=1 Tax=Cytobacillus spongiae TaxID=2901381 RepID=UPI001F158232|nr:S66 peptidase family protein [Cytobacillus spongiae]UII58578.1 LD-carboxypeptidase [Cytobacillus spongiae]
MTIPPRLTMGDTIGICSPSSPVAAHCPKRLKRGMEELKRLGFNVKVAPNTLKLQEYMAGTIDERVDDLHDLFKDKEVKAIITTIGGTCSHQLLEHLDFGLIEQNPKIFLGYSDITALHLAIYKKTGLTTYLGPAVLPQFGEFGGLLTYTRDHFFQTFVKGERAKYDSSSDYVMEHLWWDEEDDRLREKVSNEGPRVVKAGKAEGKIIAANMGTMLLLAGTEYFPEWKGSILCIEDDPDETPSSIDRYLTQLRHMGVLAEINGLVVGRFHDHVGFKENQLAEILSRVTEGYEIPVVTDLDFGHTDPMFVLPNGIQAEITVNEKQIDFRLKENPVS